MEPTYCVQHDGVVVGFYEIDEIHQAAEADPDLPDFDIDALRALAPGEEWESGECGVGDVTVTRTRGRIRVFVAVEVDAIEPDQVLEVINRALDGGELQDHISEAHAKMSVEPMQVASAYVATTEHVS